MLCSMYQPFQESLVSKGREVYTGKFRLSSVLFGIPSGTF